MQRINRVLIKARKQAKRKAEHIRPAKIREAMERMTTEQLKEIAAGCSDKRTEEIFASVWPGLVLGSG